jgi:hypothetical protein
MRPRRSIGASGRPLNFTVRPQEDTPMRRTWTIIGPAELSNWLPAKQWDGRPHSNRHRCAKVEVSKQPLNEWERPR